MILSINEHVSAVLAGDRVLQTYVHGRCYPIASIEDVAFPLIAYERLSVTPVYDKSARCMATSNVTVVVAAASYSESLIVAELVIKALDKKDAHYDSFDVVDAVFTAATEDYNDGVYVQQVEFTFTIKEN